MKKQMTGNSRTRLLLTALAGLGSFTVSCLADEIVGNIRVQVLSPTLLRIEQKGPKGFENRPTFHVTERSWPEVATDRSSSDGFEWIKTSAFTVKVPTGTRSLDGITVLDPQGNTLWSMPPADAAFFSNNRHWIPNPNEKTKAWAIVDTPRYVPAAPDMPWGGGYNVAPKNIPNNGWDLDNDAPDVYIFLPKGDGRKLRSDFIALTGRTDLVPLYALGGWDSRYYAYTQPEAQEKIDTYRSKGIPLDVFVVDTDWRVGASHGYGVNTELFPDMEQFIDEAHGKNVRIVFNDHPEPQADVLDHKEVLYRNEGLRSKFEMGLDVWWFDRNWHTAIRPPKGINKEVFGMYLFHWITQDFYPDRRPFIMANIDGIDNGRLNRSPDMAAHRYNMQWTGDTTCDMASLKREVNNAVYSGVYAPFAYTSTDLGGHMGQPPLEEYCRWVQFGALSPFFRLHCTRGITRDPWDYGNEGEKVVRDYVQMRMRLLPVFYTAARDNYDTGEPILKRCDLNYPEYAEAQSNDQYLLGDNILVAPIMGGAEATVPSDWLASDSGTPGLDAAYFADKELSGDPATVRIDEAIDFNWHTASPAAGLPADNYSVRWSGTITPRAGHDVDLGISSDDGCRLWIDGKPVIDQWVNRGETANWVDGTLKDGQKHTIRLEYFENVGDATCRLLFRKHLEEKDRSERELWLPPGDWKNVWTGEILQGPRMHAETVSMEQIPLFVKLGALIPLAPDMQYTAEKPWDPVTLDVYPGKDTATAVLYEDDGISNNYRSGCFRKTALTADFAEARRISVVIDPAEGTYEEARTNRSWRVRLHTSKVPTQVLVDGKKTDFVRIERDAEAMPFSVDGGSPDGDVIEVNVPSAPVSGKRSIAVVFAAE
ncbi:MAG: DUF5110 domain-containing protein [Pontiellaceae bacterium]|nr:DUF5110 domain-containing protein [Pontiellaceae bacterium]MBN2785048.1 DUF5110 domain-containing protein [Pontiellaceae bacterium]